MIQVPNKASGSHLALGDLSEAILLVGDEGILHGVHRETVEGDLGANILLETFDHSTVEPAGKAENTRPELALPSSHSPSWRGFMLT